jgi:aspartate/methionine/tyrosine aminotransferase
MDSIRFKTARRMQAIRPFYVMELLARARALEAAGRSIIHMEVGEPDFDTAAPITRAGVRALEAGLTRYTPACGLPELRRAIARFYSEQYHLSIDPDRVIVTPGASGALQLVMSVLIDPGEAVLMADPGYPCNRHFVSLVDGRPVAIAVGPESGYQLDVERVAQAWTPETRMVLVSSPSNPTGTLIAQEALQQIHRLAGERNGLLVVDEIYQGLVYEESSSTALSVADDLFVIDSFSKYFGMTGWRLGWVIAPEAYVDPMARLAQNIFLAASTPAQYAALAAFEPETLAILEQRRQAFRERRDYLLPALRELGFEIPVTPQGAFYLYANCAAFTDDSFGFCMDLLKQQGVAVTPGRDFGSNRPEQHLRFAYTTDISKLKEGVERLSGFLEAPSPPGGLG